LIFIILLIIKNREEARNVNSKGEKNAKYDYMKPFILFDENNDGIITYEEFKKILIRLQLITDNIKRSHMKILMNKFDVKHKGFIKIEDFVRFAEEGKDVDDDYIGNIIDILFVLVIIVVITVV
jgi:Ca2+-binding EF-hand superfamily protein